MGAWPVVLYQFKSQLSKSHITIAPSHYQVTVNPSNGKKERVFVDLQAVYPSPEVPGTELSFEEIWAANRGWLDQSWQKDGLVGGKASKDVKNAARIQPQREAASLVVRQDIVTLDENGRLPDQHRAGREKKTAEVNETQISRWTTRYMMRALSTNSEQSKRSWTRRPVPRL